MAAFALAALVTIGAFALAVRDEARSRQFQYTEFWMCHRPPATGSRSAFGILPDRNRKFRRRDHPRRAPVRRLPRARHGAGRDVDARDPHARIGHRAEGRGQALPAGRQPALSPRFGAHTRYLKQTEISSCDCCRRGPVLRESGGTGCHDQRRDAEFPQRRPFDPRHEPPICRDHSGRQPSVEFEDRQHVVDLLHLETRRSHDVAQLMGP